jgi:hypothetical protein
MEQSRLRRHAGIKYALLDPILEELARDGKVSIEENISIILYRF